MSEKPWLLVVRGILQDDQGRYLLLKRSHKSKSWSGFWEFPGGKIDPGESLSLAIEREFLEETGLEIYPEKLFKAFEFEREKDKIIYLIFIVVKKHGDLLLSHEHDDSGWFTLDELKMLDISPSLKNLVKELL